MTRHAAEQGAELVKRLLAFARRQTLEPKAIDVARLWSSIDDLLTHTLGGLVQLEWHPLDGAACIYADESQLQLALMNLIINARDAMPDGGEVTVSASEEQFEDGNESGLKPGRYVRIRVTDTGAGIAAEHLEKVLEPFYSTKEVGKGTGLGLPMVYGFIKQSGGTMRMQSDVGTGTIVDLWLPACEASPAMSDEALADASSVAMAESLSILLVDDTESVRATTAALLEDLGHDVTEAGAAPAALDIIEQTPVPFDLIVTDYAMPRMSGAELIERAREKMPQASAIIITGYATRPRSARPRPTRPFSPSRSPPASSSRPSKPWSASASASRTPIRCRRSEQASSCGCRRAIRVAADPVRSPAKRGPSHGL